MARPRILSVGQCAYDRGQITRRFRQGLDAEVVNADTFDEALLALRSESFGLVLVNRVTDADGAPGLDLIRTLKEDPELSALPVMLVSNFPEAQARAVALGALPGFGKADLSSPRTLEQLRTVLGEGHE